MRFFKNVHAQPVASSTCYVSASSTCYVSVRARIDRHPRKPAPWERSEEGWESGAVRELTVIQRGVVRVVGHAPHVGPCVVRGANMGRELAGGDSSWCPELEVWTTPIAREACTRKSCTWTKRHQRDEQHLSCLHTMPSIWSRGTKEMINPVLSAHNAISLVSQHQRDGQPLYNLPTHAISLVAQHQRDHLFSCAAPKR